MSRSRRSLRTQIDEVMAQMTDLAKEEKPAPAKCNMLVTQLETLRFLLQTELRREDKEKELPAKVEDTASTLESPTKSDPLDDIVRGMLERHANQVQTPATVTASKTSSATATLPPRPVTTDDDLLV